MEKIKKFLKINVFLLIILSILITLTIYLLISNKPVLLSAIGTIIIAISTMIYTYYSWRTVTELKEQNKQLKEKEFSRYILDRSAITKKLLSEMNDNEYNLMNLKKEIVNTLEINRQNGFKDFGKTFLKNYETSDFNIFKDYFIVEVYIFFNKSYIDYKDKEVLFQINRYYFIGKMLKKSIDFMHSKSLNNEYNKELYIEINNKKINRIEFKLINMLKNIDHGLEIVDIVYDKLSKEINFNFKKSKYYYDSKK